jgi:hypothetical protein
MHTLNPTARFLTLAVLGVVAGAIITSCLQDKMATYGRRRIAQVTKELTVVQTGVQGQYATAWQTLKSKSEAQIKANDVRIITFKEQRASASSTFRPIYDRRVAELERRNIALQGKLNNFKGDRRETWAEVK